MSDHASGSRRRLGQWGENVAALHLEAGGLALVERNWRCRDGEIGPNCSRACPPSTSRSFTAPAIGRC